jgi:nucleoside-diphosphate-sugar epimerase
LHEVDKPENLNTSSLRLFNMCFRQAFPENELLFSLGWVDVRDLAKAHIVALEREEAGDERILVASPSTPNQEFIEAAKRAAALLGVAGVQTGVQNYDPANVTRVVRFSRAKRDRILGIEMTSVDDTVRDTIANFKERGWVSA